MLDLERQHDRAPRHWLERLVRRFFFFWLGKPNRASSIIVKVPKGSGDPIHDIHLPRLRDRKLRQHSLWWLHGKTDANAPIVVRENTCRQPGLFTMFAGGYCGQIDGDTNLHALRRTSGVSDRHLTEDVNLQPQRGTIKTGRQTRWLVAVHWTPWLALFLLRKRTIALL
jgi:hypothetical protein